jgi:glycosyltransferase involved in cell wall biosynthesis
LYPLAAKVVCVSKGVMNELAKSFSINENKCVFIGNPVEIKNDISRIPQDLEYWIKDRQFFLAVGRLVPQKGFDYLLDAFAKIKNETHLDLLILGEGESRPRLEEQMDRLDLKVGYLCQAPSQTLPLIINAHML